MKNYYDILGVARDAEPAAIKQAYRRMASQHHPDKGGDTTKFQEIEEAYRVLSDPAQRQQYDRPQGHRVHINAGHGGAGFSFEDILGSMFRSGFGQQQRRAAQMSLWITLADVAQGGKRIVSVTSPHGSTNVEINLPQGVADGETVRYPELAPGGIDLIVQFRIRPDPQWIRDGDNVLLEVTFSMWDLILGTEITISTLTNQMLTINVPPKTQPGKVLRVKGHGLPAKNGTQGDLLMRVQGKLPETISEELLAQIQKERGR